jgi:very-short-patch-repair endonuclease
MHIRTTTKIFARAKELSRNLTPAEAKLWGYLRAHHIEDVHFRKQHAIGNYIVDFCALRKKLIIELDGSQHLEQEEYDLERTAFLKSKGYRVLRFWNNDVMNDIDGVICAIVFAMEENGHDTK